MQIICDSQAGYSKSVVSLPESGENSLVTLGNNRLWSRVLPDHTRLSIRCEEGALWITQEGIQKDFVLAHGNCAEFAGPGLIVVSALDFASFSVVFYREQLAA